MRQFIASLFILLSTSAALATGVGEDDRDTAAIDPPYDVEVKEKYAEDKAKDSGNETESTKDSRDSSLDDNESSSESGIGFFTWILVLAAGAAAGYAGGMFAVARSRQNMPQMVDTPAEINRAAVSRHTQEKPEPKPEPESKTAQKEPVEKKEEARKEKEVKEEKTVIVPDDEPVIETVKPAEPAKPAQPVLKRAFVNFIIPEQGLIIARQKNISTEYSNQLFEVTLNENTGSGTYTIASGRMSDIVKHLSALESFVDKFEYKPGAERVNVVSQGTLKMKEGYWQVTDLLKIEMI